ncbi:hypothetical protein F5Y15DRAFT_429971 [Xylariaceae sp. FL0016]|nr:hypothetical protein F5Y15DRAFT_429971 [Xylariaceae sp. FL0016]
MDVDELRAVLEVGTVVPAVNQIEYHPYMRRTNIELLTLMECHRIKTSGFDCLAPITKVRDALVPEVLAPMAERYSVTKEALLIRWALDENVAPVIRVPLEAKIEECLSTLRFGLTDSDRLLITVKGYENRHPQWLPIEWDELPENKPPGNQPPGNQLPGTS